MNTYPSNLKSTRLASLDILRGFDLFLLVFFQPVFFRLGKTLGWSWLDPILYQFDHEVWEGFHFWDLIMPLFLFMAGTSMPFFLPNTKMIPTKAISIKKYSDDLSSSFYLEWLYKGIS